MEFLETTFSCPRCGNHWFTVTIEDGYNFRARIYSGRYCDPQSQFPDFRLDDEDLITEFSLDCSKLRCEYPGLCTFDFQEIMKVIERRFLGWGDGYHMTGKGLFGKVDGFATAIKEQSRKTLHFHMLVWIRNFNKIIAGLHDESFKEKCIEVLVEYVDTITSTAIHKKSEYSCFVCDNRLQTLDDIQDYRNL